MRRPWLPATGIIAEVEQLLDEHPVAKARTGQVLDLVKAYESVYGMELMPPVRAVVGYSMSLTPSGAPLSKISAWAAAVWLGPGTTSSGRFEL